MLRFCIISCVLCVYACKIQAQNGLADSLLHYEKQYFESKNDTVKQFVLLKKIDFYRRNNITNSSVFNVCERVNLNLLTDQKQKSAFLWNAALLSYLNGKDERCLARLQNYTELAGEETTEVILLQVLANRNYDTLVMSQKIRQLTLRDSVFNHLRSLIDLAVYERKHLNFYLVSSAIVPGSGTAMNGEPLKGLVSLALAAGSVYGIVKLVQYGLYINTALLGSSVALKFYSGNIRLTQKAFERKELKQKSKLAHKSELNLIHVLNKYPLNWKGL